MGNADRGIAAPIDPLSILGADLDKGYVSIGPWHAEALRGVRRISRLFYAPTAPPAGPGGAEPPVVLATWVRVRDVGPDWLADPASRDPVQDQRAGIIRSAATVFAGGMLRTPGGPWASVLDTVAAAVRLGNP